MKKILNIDFIVYALLRTVIFFLSLLPSVVRKKLIFNISKLAFTRWKRVSDVISKNYSIASSELSEFFPKGYDSLLDSMSYYMSLLIEDIVTIDKVSKDWVEAKCDISDLKAYFDQKKTAEVTKGTIFLTGHLGCFEYIPQVAGCSMTPSMFIVRPFGNKYIDNWWTKKRERFDNKLLARNSSVSKILKGLKEGKVVGILFDQNVTRKNSVFVDWFGMEASTTMGPSYLTLRTGCDLLVGGLLWTDNGGYEFLFEKVDYSDLKKEYDDLALTENISKDELSELRNKLYTELTQRSVKRFEKFILKQPGSWFWFHRRWKTRPEGEPEDVYNQVK